MEIRLSADGAYRHQYHVVWIPKYRKRILKGELKAFVEQRLLVIIIPPKYSVSSIIGKIKANTSREIRQHFEWIRKMYRRNEFWSPGFFSSTVGIDEEVIKRYVEFQEKMDKGQLQLSLDFKF